MSTGVVLLDEYSPLECLICAGKQPDCDTCKGRGIVYYPDYVIVPREVRDLYDFIDCAFVAVTGQQREIMVCLDKARAAMKAMRKRTK